MNPIKRLMTTTAMCSLALIGMSVPALADITTTTTTIYSYDFPDQGSPTSTSTSTTSSGSCPAVYTGGGGGGEGDPDVGSVDTSGDGVTDASCSGCSGMPDQFGGAGQTGGVGSDSGGGECVLCTYYYKKGIIPRKIYVADGRYAERFIDEDTMRGYHYWAVPLVRLLQTGNHPSLEKFFEKVVVSWAYEMAYRVGVAEKSNVFGWLMTKICEPICRKFGRSVGTRDYKALWV